jgi:hypothetical protein
LAYLAFRLSPGDVTRDHSASGLGRQQNSISVIPASALSLGCFYRWKKEGVGAGVTPSGAFRNRTNQPLKISRCAKVPLVSRQPIHSQAMMLISGHSSQESRTTRSDERLL